jgi:hypothetical protein
VRRPNKRLRGVTRFAEGLGIKGIKIEQGRKHAKLSGILPNGAPLSYTLAVSPSDWRGERNVRADLRRAARP